MPVVGIGADALRKHLGVDVPRERLLEILGTIGCDVEGFGELLQTRCTQCSWIEERTASEEAPATCDRCATDHRNDPVTLEELPPLEVIRMELLAVRPDIFDPGGLARALRGYLGIEVGRKVYEIGEEAAVVHCDPSIRHQESWRPYIACAVMENVQLDGESVKILMKLQENLHWALGRDRKHASIGVYDFDTITSEIEYTTEVPDQYAFVPLGAPGTDKTHLQMLRDILTYHPKGRAYQHLLQTHKRYPILRDSTGLVLSMPPIINSEQTKVHAGSNRLFIDVTGLGSRIINRSLNILVTSLLELLPEARLRAVKIEGGTDPADSSKAIGPMTTPDLSPQKTVIDVEHASRLIGIDLDSERATELLRKMRHDVRPLDGHRLEVDVSAYRNDILHERDLMEDIAIAHGYQNIVPELLPARTVGQSLGIENVSAAVREILSGLGLQEVLTLILSNEGDGDIALGHEEDSRAVQIANPISTEQTRLRTRLLPGLLQVFRHNLHQPLPQRIFEVGDVTWFESEAETTTVEQRRVAFGIVSPKAGFTDVRSIVEAIGREFGVEMKWESASEPPFIEGRCGQIRIGETVVGWFGEVDPEVLVRFGLENPAVMGELSINVLAGMEPRQRFRLED